MAIREGLLALLRGGPQHGYQLKTAFELATGGVWPLNVGQVYSTLDRLERDGLVEITVVDPASAQKPYVLTVAGEAEVARWWESSGVDGPPPRDELLLKVLMALGQGRGPALEVITRQRTALLGHLQRIRRAHRAAPARADGAAVGADESLAAVLVNEALIARAEADLRWLDACEAHLSPSRARRR
jgi:DNA-binding PadR family transcriptional regulator